MIPYLKKDGHGRDDASFLDGRAEAVKVIWIVKVDLHLGWETEHKQLKEWTRRRNAPAINHSDAPAEERLKSCSERHQRGRIYHSHKSPIICVILFLCVLLLLESSSEIQCPTARGDCPHGGRHTSGRRIGRLRCLCAEIWQNCGLLIRSHNYRQRCLWCHNMAQHGWHERWKSSHTK